MQSNEKHQRQFEELDATALAQVIGGLVMPQYPSVPRSKPLGPTLPGNKRR
jgi:bacteriocin-like protein